jgi:Asp-tRNA(Asn)/Glu-tRNA(Gln) amidotransferase A subunit family amidase
MPDKLLDQSIRVLAADLRDGSVTAEALIEAAIARHDQRGEVLQAYKHWDPDRARREARAVDTLIGVGHDAGPLMGLPLSIKDIYGVAGMPICAGTPKELPETWRKEGPVVGALRRGLGIVMGKSHTVELAFGGVGATLHWPAPRNPWDGEAHRVCGGSSAGAGVSLAEGSAVHGQRHRRLCADPGQRHRHRRPQDHHRPLVGRGHRAAQRQVRYPGAPDPFGGGRGGGLRGDRSGPR